MKFFLITIVQGTSLGQYRVMANTQETAEQRAQVSFKNEYGLEGTVEHSEQVE